MFKKAVLTLLLPVLLSTPTYAADDPITGNSGQKNQAVENFVKPYMVVGNYKQDQNRIFMFFSYTCPYCQKVWWGMEQWGKTLPVPYRFVAIPTVTTVESSRVAAIAYFIAKQLRPERLDEFNRYAYSAGENRTDTDGKGYITALLKLGLTEAEIKKAANSQRINLQIQRAMNLAKRYNVRQTPSFAIAGKYTTDIGYTDGDYKNMVKLLNAIISQNIEERTK